MLQCPTPRLLASRYSLIVSSHVDNATALILLVLNTATLTSIENMSEPQRHGAHPPSGEYHDIHLYEIVYKF